MTRLWQTLTGIPLFLVSLAWLMALITLGTLAQAHMPLLQAQRIYFETPIFWLANTIPTPGLPLILGYMAFSLLVQLVTKPLKPATAGTWLAHAGVLLLILSGLAALSAQYGYVVALEGTPTRLWQAEGATETTPPAEWPAQGLLPFTVTVDKFTATFHPGTRIPAMFASDVTITPDAGLPWKATISMNDPLRTQGYTLYQASYVLDDNGGPPTSILAVVHDRTRLLPYIATGVLALGLLLHVFLRWKASLLLIPLLCTLPYITHAEGVMPAQAGIQGETQAVLETTPKMLGHIPVQHQGRIKPLATVATTAVPFILGHSMGYDASLQTLTLWLTSPSTILNEARLAIPKPSTQQTLGLPPGGSYTLMQIVAALGPLQNTIQQLETLPPAQLAAPQTDLLTIAERADTALALARTFILLQPMHMPSPAFAKALGVSTSTPLPAATLLAKRETLLKLTQTLTSAKPLTPLQQETMRAAYQLRSLRPDIPNTLLRIIPAAPGQTNWLTPWMALQPTANLTPTQQATLSTWETFIANPTTSPPTTSPTLTLQLELWWLQYSPITLALIPLALALLFIFLPYRLKLPIYLLSLTGFTLLGFGLLARMIILARPPVATLYESVLFVAWATLGMALLGRKSHPATLPVGLGSALLLTAVSHGLTQGTDTMGMLTAVLNTNFWLTTHVLCITGGYGASMLVGGMGLWALGQRVTASTTAHRLQTLARLRTITLWALALTATGTLLGGIWAGQSWGRFWGWDPKENGALLLTLWLIGLAHARMLKPTPWPALLAASAGTSIVVALSWFGVNLLNVGLHSYGFTTGLATWLAIFCGGYASIILGLLIFNRYGNQA